MKTDDIVILGLAAVAVFMILKSGKTESAGGTKVSGAYTSVPITADNPYGVNGWTSVPWNRDTEIPMQPGGGY